MTLSWLCSLEPWPALAATAASKPRRTGARALTHHATHATSTPCCAPTNGAYGCSACVHVASEGNTVDPRKQNCLSHAKRRQAQHNGLCPGHATNGLASSRPAVSMQPYYALIQMEDDAGLSNLIATRGPLRQEQQQHLCTAAAGTSPLYVPLSLCVRARASQPASHPPELLARLQCPGPSPREAHVLGTPGVVRRFAGRGFVLYMVQSRSVSQ